MLLAKAAECGSLLAVLHIANTLVIRTSANHIGFSRCSSTRTMVVKKGMKELHYFYCAVCALHPSRGPISDVGALSLNYTTLIQCFTTATPPFSLDHQQPDTLSYSITPSGRQRERKGMDAMSSPSAPRWREEKSSNAFSPFFGGGRTMRDRDSPPFSLFQSRFRDRHQPKMDSRGSRMG